MPFKIIWKAVDCQDAMETVTWSPVFIPPTPFFSLTKLILFRYPPFPQAGKCLGEWGGDDPSSRNKPDWSNGDIIPSGSGWFRNWHTIPFWPVRYKKNATGGKVCFGESFFSPKREAVPYVWTFSVWTWYLELLQPFCWNLRKTNIEDGRTEKEKVPGSLRTQSSCYMNLPWRHPTTELPAIPDITSVCNPVSVNVSSLIYRYPIILTKENTFYFLLLWYHLLYSYSEHDKMPFPSLAVSHPRARIILYCSKSVSGTHLNRRYSSSYDVTHSFRTIANSVCGWVQ